MMIDGQNILAEPSGSAFYLSVQQVSKIQDTLMVSVMRDLTQMVRKAETNLESVQENLQ